MPNRVIERRLAALEHTVKSDGFCACPPVFGRSGVRADFEERDNWRGQGPNDERKICTVCGRPRRTIQVRFVGSSEWRPSNAEYQTEIN